MKYRVVASVSWEIEVTNAEVEAVIQKNKDAGYDVSEWAADDLGSDIAYDKLQKLTFADASWDNVHDFDRIEK